MLASSDGVGRSEDDDSAQLLENVFFWRGVPENSVIHATVSSVNGYRDRPGWAALGPRCFMTFFFPLIIDARTLTIEGLVLAEDCGQPCPRKNGACEVSIRTMGVSL